MKLEALQKELGVKFHDRKLLDSALTHTSYVHEQKRPLEESNERLEFLGDSILNLCVAEMLVRVFQNEPEGVLSKRRAALVNQKQLFLISQKLDIGSYLKLGKGEEKTGGRAKESVLGDALEAIIGALFLDQGFESCQKLLHRLFYGLVQSSHAAETSQDFKTKLQEHHQRHFKKSPRYVVESALGPDHAKTFVVRIEFDGQTVGRGQGRSKREAEQAAAEEAFKGLTLLPLEEKTLATRSRPTRRAKSDSQKTRGTK